MGCRRLLSDEQGRITSSHQPLFQLQIYNRYPFFETKKARKIHLHFLKSLLFSFMLFGKVFKTSFASIENNGLN